MKKLSNFIVEKRKILLILFTVLAIAGGILMNFVDINYDLTSYLPEDSNAKKGMEIMSDEFGESTYINVMFKNLKEGDTEKILKELSEIKNVANVLYDSSSEYHNGINDLFVVNLSVNGFSDEAAAVLDEITDKYNEYDSYTTGPVSDNKYMGVGIAVLAVAFLIIVIILFIMCSSWIEPLIFAVTIGIAVLLNEGTNIILPNVSSMTKSIAALLQMVLSMDYSIMLMDRYRQEKDSGEDKVTAMKNALNKGFLAIAGSSMTTIVGLLCLVFMSFTIGADIGIVLAKGVVFSLLTILFFLPGLTIICDKLIEKTHKKALILKMGKLATFEFKAKYIITAIFAVILVAAFLMKDFLLIEYSVSSQNPDEPVVTEAFTPKNTFVLLYNNKDENKMKDLTDYILSKDKIRSISGYATTIGKKMSATEISTQLGIDPTLVNIIFNNYFGNTKDKKMTMTELVEIIKEDIENNGFVAGMLDEETKAMVLQITGIANKKFLRTPFSAKELSEYLNIDKELLSNIYFLHNLTYNDFDISAVDLMTFIYYLQALEANLNNLPLGFDAYVIKPIIDLAKGLIEFFNQTDEGNAFYRTLTSEQQEALNNAAVKINKGEHVSASEFMNEFGIYREYTEQLISLFYVSTQTEEHRISTAELVSYISGLFNRYYELLAEYDISREQIYAIDNLISSILSNTELKSKTIAEYIANIIGRNIEPVIDIFYSYSAAINEEQKLNIEEFIDYILINFMSNPLIAEYFDESMEQQLIAVKKQIASGKESMIGKNYSRLIIDTDYGIESEDAFGFIEDINKYMEKDYEQSYFAGTSAVSYDTSKNFTSELNFITILIIISVFIVVALTFRSALIPIVLVALIQCAVYLTMSVSYLQGVGTYYLALIIVQSILMGATIDYAILFTEYYRKLRLTENIRNSIKNAYKGSINTILTSSSILVLVTFVISQVASDVTTAKVCLTISKGSLFSVLLVVFVLPALLAVFDKFISGKNRFIEQ
ncbi:MMPL family transporter [Eubacteriales bacterium OttesenSCG-928-G02]|nr:MMPL family transporter [Eubacteriales bacterium OttesenSCG-928-G02]